jgi:hypothetical protein
MYAISYTDSQATSLTYLTTDLNDPLDWDNPTAVFRNETDAANYAANAYEVLISYIPDWKSVALEVVTLTEQTDAKLNADGNNLY